MGKASLELFRATAFPRVQFESLAFRVRRPIWDREDS
jgi:hypothetical protein